jgi:hypothetical protein
MRTLASVAVAAILVGSLVPTTDAQTVIDSFETGTFHLVAQADEFVTGTYSVSNPAHAMAAFRTVELLSFDGVGLPAYADLDAWTTADDAVRFTFGPDGGVAALTYEPFAALDLTGAGANDRVEIDFSASTVGGTVELRVWDADGAYETHSQATSGGVHGFPLLQFAGIDFTRVVKLAVLVDRSAGGAYDIRDIRAMRRHASWNKFDVPTATVVGPPYPMNPFVFMVTDAVPSDFQRIRLLRATKTATGADAAMALTAMDSGEGAIPGYAGAVRVKWNQPGVAFESSAFDVQVDVSALSGIDPQPFLPALPVAVETPSGFVLVFDVHFPSGAGGIARTSRRQLPFDALPGQALRFANVNVHPPDSVARVGTSGFRVTFDVLRTGAVDTAVPLFEATFTGDCIGEAAVGAPVAIGTGGGAGLVAWPSVTRTGTDLRLSRPSEAGGTIDLFDVAGRRFRSLAVSRGSRGVFWDGCDSDGRPVAAGITFARVAGGDPSCCARIVVVR